MELHEPMLDAKAAVGIAERPQDREFVEALWRMYAPYAEPRFRQLFLRETQARFWEMYLTCALLRQAKNVVRRMVPKGGRVGPDVMVREGSQTIWFEAYAASHGTGANAVPVPDCPSDPAKITWTRVPHDEITLRYTAGIKEKFEKYEGYAGGKPVKDEDIRVIAISSGAVHGRYTELEIPRILQAVFPIGYPVATINTETMKIAGSSYQHREKVGAVETTYFCTPKFASISAVLFSYVNIWNPSNLLGNDFVVVHNPFATTPLPRGWLKLGREFWVEGGILQPEARWYESACHHCA